MTYDPRFAGSPRSTNLQGPLPPYDPRAALDFSRPKPPTVTIGGKTYLVHDNGRANVLIPYTYATNPTGPAPQQQARDANRVGFMAGHPLGAAAYGAASALNAPEWARDLSLAVGGTVDTLLFGAAPVAARGPMARPTPAAPRTYAPPLPQPARSYGALDAQGRPTRADSWVTKDTLGTGTRSSRSVTPPGWGGNGRRDNQARGHLDPRLHGGFGEYVPNIVTLTQNPTNHPLMSGVEARAARAAAKGEVIRYSAVPLYAPGGAAPSHIFIFAYGSRGYRDAAVIGNPAGRRK